MNAQTILDSVYKSGVGEINEFSFDDGSDFMGHGGEDLFTCKILY